MGSKSGWEFCSSLSRIPRQFQEQVKEQDMEQMKIVYMAVDDLKPYENNPRKNDEAVRYVANSIKEFGFKVPIIITKDREIVAGHTRLKAAKRLKMKEVPCIIADDLTEEQIKAFRLADNKVAEFAEWDFDALAKEIGGVSVR